ncbi:hypothetical protein MNBD_GAMMA03-1856 [hydrothermal vent metagenome]|uniref:peptidylprolyl isomerase n=1 Tax=hydrothermal vent metagenome TaxID=652676 RepID=A0A3B0VSN9_9ZZZZ
MQKQGRGRLMFWKIPFFVVLFIVMGGALASTSSEKEKKLFAVVDGYEITEAIYLTALQTESKRRYFHGRLTEERLAELKKDVARNLIDQVLLIHEAERQGLKPDSDKIDLALEQFDKRYAQDKAWQKDRKRMLPVLRKQFESRELTALLEKKTRSDFILNEALKKKFYKKNPGLFIFPERKKVSIILIRVSPSALSKEWSEAQELLATIAERIAAGESFSELAKEYSDDETASQGGSMGYQHKGMLHSDVENVLDELAVGGLSEPIRLLQGYILVRLEGVIPAQPINYEDAKEQVVQLLSRKLSDERWKKLLIDLRSDANIVRF